MQRLARKYFVACVQALRQELGLVSSDKQAIQAELMQQGSLLLSAQASSASMASLEQQKSMVEESAAKQQRKLERALAAECDQAELLH